MESSLRSSAEAWLQIDKDVETHDEVSKLLSANNVQELQLRFSSRLAFGTAGLRGPMRAGSAGMNSLVVIQTSQGLAQYVSINVENAKERGVVIGRDARHRSERFAKLTAAAFVAKGFRVHWLQKPAPTPLVSLAVSLLGAAAGVVITASHNAKLDNGYKVYWENGCQIISPLDARIADAIMHNLEPVSWDLNVTDGRSELVSPVLDTVLDGYIRRIMNMTIITNLLNIPPFVYTPMHGVGLETMQAVLQRLGVSNSTMTVVAEQAQPDPDFPTVKFPNPEEQGALDLAIATANNVKVDVIIANDPDADRLAVAERQVDGSWHLLTGNETGILLAAYMVVYNRALSKRSNSTHAMLNSTVSSRMLKSLTQNHGIHYEETLTGFKWLGNMAQQLEQNGLLVDFAFEEALGYMLPQVCWDKDGISAAVLILGAAGTWKAIGGGGGLRDKLHSLYEEYGYFVDANTYLISPSPEVTNAVFNTIRDPANPAAHPQSLGPYKIESWRDLTRGYQSDTPDHRPNLPVDSGAQMITIELDNGVRVTARGSGTEPKIKLYIEAKASSEEEARRMALEARKVLIDEWFPEHWGLKMP